MAKAKGTVFIVDDDKAVRESLSWLLESVQLNVEAYEAAEEFLEHYSMRRIGCLILDIRIPGMGGLKLQQKLQEQKYALPIIIISGHADVSIAVRAMKNGAFDFVEKPVKEQELLDTIQVALEQDEVKREKRIENEAIQARINNLTPREREVLMLILDNYTNKEMAKKLRLNIKTIEAHRARLMHKMYANSLLELVKMMVDMELS